MPEPIKGNARYMGGLDGLRALAVLAVIAYHLNLRWAPGGFLGVVVFFVLSGYLITDQLVAKWDQRGRMDFRDFWLRRARRLLPAMLILLIAVVAWTTFFDHNLLAKLRGDVVAALLYISNWWFIFHNVSYFDKFGLPSPLNNLWSLAVEEQFYLIWPLLLYLGLRFVKQRGLLILLTILIAIDSALLMAVLYEPGADPSRVYYGTDTRMFSLLIGAALALVWPSRKLSKKVPRQARVILDLTGTAGLIAVLYMVWKTNQFDPSLYRGGMVVISIATAVLVAVLAHPVSYLAKMFSWKPLRWIGVRSYGIYLWHYPVIVLTTPAVNTGGTDILRCTLQIAASIGLAALSWRYIEDPIRHGAIKKLWTQLRSHGWRWSRLSIISRIAIGCAFLIFGISCVGMAAPSPDKPEHAKVTSVNTTDKPASTDEKKPPKPKKNTGKKQEGQQKPAPVEQEQSVTAIGDSVLIDAAPYLENQLPGIVISAHIGRQMSEGEAVVDRLKSKGKLGDCVIIELGTNGPFTETQLKSLVNSIGRDRQIVLVNTRVSRPWENAVNAALQKAASDFANIKLVNWYEASAGKNSYFAPDGVHLNPEGAEQYASLVANVVNKVGK
ncbi:peptidoglycan-N-acetylmuramate O-acetyltransferase [Scopulibacillus darangshiensis]|uniref:Peptidoglycan-N-acetylmuramate O-acetyltransferase n=1 Tax=Scopulibacillus darangshiensis TaxID=442528 RepID=A0A4R2NLB7_9BACL|nr:acyltransferase family protein [Scopulibacillus darangshiensis]TCP22347.1 peptidoglycan-N-acetylmuramate O-acetyltransferase [Scopulibacillus darangshiensis]